MPVEQWLSPDWTVLRRTFAVAVVSYIVLVVFLRMAGNRTLAKMNAFDMVITVSLGSTLASIIVSKDVELAQGALALALLVGLQYAITWSSVRLRWVRRFVTGSPTLLVLDGEFLHQAMRAARVNQDDIEAAVRGAGLSAMKQVGAVVLETDGSFSVITASDRSTITLVGIDLSEACRSDDRQV